MTEPLVSVILPVFNAGAHLIPCLRSLLAQDYVNFEIIAIDDGSTDGSAAILEAFSAKDPRLSVLSRENRGLIPTLNEALGLCRGDLIARMDADDVAYPERLSVQVGHFLADAELAICGCRYDILYGRDRVLRIDGIRQSDAASLAALVIFFPMLLHPTVMYRRSLIGDAMLRYDDGYPCAEDFDLFRRIAGRHRARLTDRPLLAYRVHEGSVSATRKAMMRRTHIRILTENLEAVHCYQLDDALIRLIDQVSGELVERAASVMADLDAIARSMPAHLQPAYREGIQNLFFFLYTIIWESGRTRLLARFVQRCGRISEIRRRERYLLRLRMPGKVGAALLALLRGIDVIVRHFNSIPARKVIAGFERW